MRNRLYVRAAVLAAILFASWSGTAHASRRRPVPQRLPASSVARHPSSLRLTILHTNDTHGHLLPYSYPETFDSDSPLTKLAAHRNIGGIARRATLIKRIRSDTSRKVLVIDAGDICDGTPFSTEYHGDADVAAMNHAGYDLACPGNHEYNNALPQVKRLVAEARYPLLSANSAVQETGKPLFKPYIVRRIGGVKIAFLGLLTYEARSYPAARDGIRVAEPLAAARKLVPALRRQADLVVAVTHIGYEVDRKLARAVPGIDVIVGGHSHTMLARPVFVKSATGPYSGTVIVQDFQWAGTLGRLDLTLARSSTGRWSVQRYTGSLIPVTSSVPQDPEVARVVSAYWNPIAPKYGRVVGHAAADFSEKGPDRAEYNLVADAVREETGADFDIENMGGVRALLARGTITYADAVSMDPFGNSIVTFDVTGRQLKGILAQSRPAVSGIRYVVDSGKLVEATINGKPIEDDRVYHGATNSFMAQWEGLRELPNLKDTGRQRLDALLRYLAAHDAAVPAYDGRRILRHTRDYE